MTGSIVVSSITVSMLAYSSITQEPYESPPSLIFLLNKGLFTFSKLLPIQAILLIGMIIIAGAAVLRLKTRRVLWKDWFSFYLLIFIAGFWLAYILLPSPLPRYSGFAVFPTCVFIALNIRRRYCNALAAGAAILLGIATMDGKFYPAMHCRSGEYLERSREYIADLRSNAAICRVLEEKAFLNPIVAKWPFVQMLTMPKLGYVTHPIPCVYAVGILPKYTSAKPFTAFKNMPDNTLYIYASNSFEAWNRFGPSLQPSSNDQIVGADSTLDGLLLVYRKKK